MNDCIKLLFKNFVSIVYLLFFNDYKSSNFYWWVCWKPLYQHVVVFCYGDSVCSVHLERLCHLFFFLSHLLVIYSYWRIKYTALKFVSENWKEKGTLGGNPNILSSGFVNFVSSAILHIKNVFAILRPFNQSHRVYSPFAPSKKKSFQNEKKVRIKISFVQSELQFLKKTVYFMSACHTSYCH